MTARRSRPPALLTVGVGPRETQLDVYRRQAAAGAQRAPQEPLAVAGRSVAAAVPAVAGLAALGMAECAAVVVAVTAQEAAHALRAVVAQVQQPRQLEHCQTCWDTQTPQLTNSRQAEADCSWAAQITERWDTAVVGAANTVAVVAVVADTIVAVAVAAHLVASSRALKLTMTMMKRQQKLQQRL